jgi:hypothetical protein
MATEMEHKLGVSEIRYGLLTLGSKSPLQPILPAGSRISVEYDGRSFSATTHATIKGRIDGLTGLVQSDRKKFRVGGKITVRYDPQNFCLVIS